jgi:hypothetical protein
MQGVTHAMPVHLFFVAQSMIALHSIEDIASEAPAQAVSSLRHPFMASGVQEQFSHAGFM